MINPVNLIDNHIVRKDIDKPDRPRELGRYWPTEASLILPDGSIVGSCLRDLYYKVTGVVGTPYDARALRIFRVGKIVEIQEKEWGAEMGMLVPEEEISYRFKKQIDDTVCVSGEVDAIYRVGSRLCLVEYKTGYGYNFEKEVFGSKYRRGTPKQTHTLQVMIYLDNYRGRIDQALIVYVNRGSLDTVSHELSLDSAGVLTLNGVRRPEYNIRAIYQRYQMLDRYIRAGTPPPRDFELEYSAETIEEKWKRDEIAKTRYADWKKKGHPGARIGDYQCGYCRFTKTCWGRV